MKVRIPSPLRSYTGGAATVDGSGDSVKAILFDLDARYPGIRFRMIDEQDGIRQHIKIFVNSEPVRKLNVAVGKDDVVHIIAALSGG
jgi:sulfur-carrier protein